MTKGKKFKKRVRARSKKTGERYTVARRHLSPLNRLHRGMDRAVVSDMNQHYVAQLYLRRFADPSGAKRGCPWVWDTTTGEVRQRPTDEICAEPNLHEVEDSSLPSLEDIWSGTYESRAGRIIPRLSRGSDVHDHWAAHFRFWLGAQLCRTLAYRDALRGVGCLRVLDAVRRLATNQDLDAWWREFRRGDREGLEERYGVEQAARFQIINTVSVLYGHFHNENLHGSTSTEHWRHVAIAHFYFTWLFFSFDFEVLVAAQKVFLTSDHPVAFSLTGGFGREGPVLIYPIDPHRCLIGWRSARASSAEALDLHVNRPATDEEVEFANGVLIDSHRAVVISSSEHAVRDLQASRGRGPSR